MAILDEVARITQAKEDFKTKLIEKGVTVSDDELISDYPPKLDLIKGGTDTTDATATANEIRKGFTAYVASGKVEGTIEDYDGSFEGGVEISGGISIPSVTNLTVTDKGVASWNAPSITSLANYEPTISYVVNVNGSEVEETTLNSINIKSYLVDGTNTISVKVKAKLIHYDNGVNTSIKYSAPVIGVVTLNATLQNNINYGSAAAVGTNVYYFGGINTNNSVQPTIQKYDTTTDTIEVLSTQLTAGCQRVTAKAVGTNIYIFGGYPTSGSATNVIQKFDAVTETITTLEATLASGDSYIKTVLIETNIYLFGGSSNLTLIQKFDTTNETITSLSATLLGKQFINVAAVDTNVYIFGGANGGKASSARVNTIQKFDAVTETITTLSNILPYKMGHVGCETLNTNIYIFGGLGVNSYYFNTILKFDGTTEKVEVLSEQLPNEACQIEAAVVDGVIYLLGGGSSERYYTILKFTT